MNTKILAILILTLTLVGCVTGPPRGRADLLNFLADNQTTKQEVILQLGQPSGRFESERILAYRLGHESGNGGYYVVERLSGAEPFWANAKYSLVLVFDGQNVLRKHSLVEVTR
jgi:hypothetical protein